jgi:RNA polymerase sigma-70 factor, ECF subfamily
MPTDGLEVALEAAARGDQAAIATLYRWLNPLLLRYLRHHVGQDAEDVASEVWLGLAPQLAGFEGGWAGLRALMFTVARRRVIDQYRHDARRKPAIELDEAFELADGADTEALAIGRIGAQDAVEALVRCLPADQAEIVLLRVLGDLDVAQVAAIVGKSAGAVRIAQHRALQHLKRSGIAPAAQAQVRAVTR